MTDDLTPGELARAKRWASMQTPPVECRTGFTGFWMDRLPPFIHSHGIDFYNFGTPDTAWSALARALRPVFKSVGPVIREECAVEIESTDVSQDLEWARGQFAAAIREMK